MNYKLFFHKLYLAWLKRTKAKSNQKSRAVWMTKGYNNTPEVSFIIQSHNKSLEVCHIVSKLRNNQNSEIIVLDDGSTMEHSKRIMSELNGANEFVIHANDLFEIIMYDRAIRMANGKFIVLLQDDDNFPNLDWVDKGIHYMNRFPDMVILGGNGGHDFVLKEETKQGVGVPYSEKKGGEFRFVHHVDRAPMFINKDLFLDKIKHINYEFAPFQFDDCEMCLRAWLNGLKVGWFDAGFTSLSAGGMRIWNNTFLAEQCEINSRLLYDKFVGKIETIDALVDKSNEDL